MAKRTDEIDWRAYDAALKNRGSVTFWFSDEAIEAWKAKKTGRRGAPGKYSDLAIETVLTVRLVYKQRLRQVEGFMESLISIMGLPLEVPDHTTLSRRGAEVPFFHRRPQSSRRPAIDMYSSCPYSVVPFGKSTRDTAEDCSWRTRWGVTRASSAAGYTAEQPRHRVSRFDWDARHSTEWLN